MTIKTIADITKIMKQTPRRGWVDHCVRNPETVWQHSVAMRGLSRRLAAYYLGPSYVEQCGKLAAVHDITEGIVPDITPVMGISASQKFELENLAINHIGTLSASGKLIKDLWLEFEKGQTKAALFVQKIDRLHVAFMALKYELANRSPYCLQTFWDYAGKHVSGTCLHEVWLDLVCQRPPLVTSKPKLVRRAHPAESYDNIKLAVFAQNRPARLDRG